MKVISSFVKRLLNQATPGLHDAKLGDIIEDLQERVERLEKAGSGTTDGGSHGAGEDTWENP